jgi:putative two-component system response regulator
MILDPQLVGSSHPGNPLSHLTTEAERYARVLVVDDDVANLRLVTRILMRAGFSNVHGVAEAEEILPTVREFEPDVVLLDLHIPGADGLDLITSIGEVAGRRSYLPVLVLTGDCSVQARDAALAAGAKDFLTKPYEATEIVLRVRNLIETRMLYVELQRQNALLTERFVARTQELEEAKIEILDRLARASDIRDDCTQAHTFRVGQLAAHIGTRMGLGELEVEQLRIAARLHDIGKIGVSDTILLKEGRLAPAEFFAQEKHTVIGANILAGSRFPVLRLAEEIALTHHESWDGTGYPRGLAGDEIPLVGRIVAVADVFDALTHERPYKQAWSRVAAMTEIRDQSGIKFDPSVVDAFFALMAELPDLEMQPDFEPPASVGQAEWPRVVRDVVWSSALG